MLWVFLCVMIDLIEKYRVVRGMTNNKAKTAAVVGAGIAGRLLAWRLLSLGYQVTIYDKLATSDQSSCSHVAAGMLSPYAEVETALVDMVTLGQASMALWPYYWENLPSGYLYGHAGSLMLAHPKDHHELTRFLGVLGRRAPGSRQFSLLNSQEKSQLEPDLSQFKGPCLHFPKEGFIDTSGLMGVLTKVLAESGVKWHTQTTIDALKPGKVLHPELGGYFDWVFDCRGLGARPQQPEVRGVRGELLHLHAPEVNISRPLRLLHPRYRVYIVPRPNQHYIVGASEIESESMSGITVRTMLELLSATFSVSSGFSEATLVNTSVQCRPALPDNLPKVSCHRVWCKSMVCIGMVFVSSTDG